MNYKQRILWITRTAVFIALLTVLQAVTASLGNPIITRSIVNLLLITSVMTSGLSSWLSVSVVSLVAAKVIGIGPLWSIMPIVVGGNVVLVLLWHFIGNQSMGRKRYIAYNAALIIAAAAKFIVLYIGIEQIAIPVFLGLPE